MKTKKINPKHVGSTLEEFLREEGILEEVNHNVHKRIIALQVAKRMKIKHKVTPAKEAQ